MSDSLLILGASARAAAASAIRAGLLPAAIDLFGDDDLRQMIQFVQLAADYPADLPQLARTAPAGAWMFTGALENHPRIVEEISQQRRPFWGISPASITRLRDPWNLARCLHAENLLYPPLAPLTQQGTPALASSQRWVRKPFRSAGGGNITCWDPGERASSSGEFGLPDSDGGRYYLQRMIDGQPNSAVFVAAGGAAVLLGVTRQLSGTDWTGTPGFRYGGSVGPLAPPEWQVAAWRRIGNSLAAAFDLEGLFGVDGIVNEEGIWTIEVNPRYTSSIEVLEYGLELHAIAEHVVACRDRRLPAREFASRGRYRGKAVIYASRDLPIDQAFVVASRRANDDSFWPEIADIPTANQTIRSGQPVATVFASSDRLDEIEPRLRDVVRAWRVRWQI